MSKGILKRRAPLRRVSAKRAMLNVERAAFVREQLARRTVCEAGERISNELDRVLASGTSPAAWLGWHCMGGATELHEPLTRARAPGRETILEVANSVAVCRACHTFIHDHPAVATALGLLVRSGGGDAG